MAKQELIDSSGSGFHRLQVTHPGRIVPPSFEAFVPFICNEGIEPNLAAQFKGLLGETFVSTHQYWRAGLCFGALEIAEVIRPIIPKYFPIGTKAAVMNYSSIHFWTALRVPDNPELVIDPAGALDVETISTLPFFGNSDYCSVNGVARKQAELIYKGSVENAYTRERMMTQLNRLVESIQRPN